MSTQDPTRIVDDTSDASPRLRELFGAGREELPAPEQLDSLAARLGPLFGPAGGGPHGGAGGGGGGGGGGAATAKIGVGIAGSAKAGLAIAALAVTIAGVGVGVWATRPAGDPARRERALAPARAPARNRPPVRAPTATTATTTSPVPEEPPVAALPTSPPRVAPRAIVRTPLPTPVSAPAPTPPPTEMSFVDPAQRALRTSPARALELAERHARQFPAGTFAQEREMIAIEALVRLGRREEATARAARFHASFPGSSHGRRVDVLLASPE